MQTDLLNVALTGYTLACKYDAETVFDMVHTMAIDDVFAHPALGDMMIAGAEAQKNGVAGDNVSQFIHFKFPNMPVRQSCKRCGSIWSVLAGAIPRFCPHCKEEL